MRRRTFKLALAYVVSASFIVLYAPSQSHHIEYTQVPVVVDVKPFREVAAQAQWYQWAASLPAPQSERRSTRSGTVTASAHLEGNLGAQQAQEDGDRFDRLAQCESGMRQDAVGGGGRYLSYFQWALTTWHAAGGEGDPRDVDYPTQKAIAMSWAERSNPAGQWPVCWPRSA